MVIGVEPVNVVHDPVVVVVFAVSGDLSGVGPEIGLKIRMVEVDAGVEHRDDRTGAASHRLGPGLGSVDVGVPAVIEAPQAGLEIVRLAGLGDAEFKFGVGLGVINFGV